jgi:hypothetical protein
MFAGLMLVQATQGTGQAHRVVFAHKMHGRSRYEFKQPYFPHNAHFPAVKELLILREV